MGFFSWQTQDTNKSIANRFSNRDTFPVTMIDDKGNMFHEPNYEGYGVFGGKDFYVLMAEMNGIEGSDDEELRQTAISLAFSDKSETLKFPNLVENPDGWTYTASEPENCDFQGFFYDDHYGDDDTYKIQNSII
jgi:hypothetical protein